MLQTIHKYRRSFIGFAGVAVIAVVMTGWGLGDMLSPKNKAAITVNDAEVSYAALYQKKREVEAVYRRMFGANFDQFAGQMNIDGQVVDSFISSLLFREKAAGWGLVSPLGADQDRRRLAEAGLYGEGFSPEAYRGYLQEIGMTGPQFETELRERDKERQVVDLLRGLNFISQKEAEAELVHQETAFDLRSVEIDPEKFQSDVEEPSSAELNSFYEGIAAQFQTEPKIKYSYVVFDPKDFSDTVQILPEDLEVYFVEHQSQFKESEMFHVRHIQINFDSAKDPKKMVALKAKAEEVREKALAGEPFDKLVELYSDDFITEKSGDLGWIRRGTRGGSFDNAMVAAKGGGISDLVVTDTGYEILKVEGYKPERLKELSEVKAEIEAAIRREQAPLYTAEKAQAFFTAFEKSGKALNDFAVENNLVAQGTGELLDKSKDPQGLHGVTARLLMAASQRSQIVEIGDQNIVAEITEVKDSEIPVLDEVKVQVLARYRAEKSKGIAQEKGKAILEALQKGVSDLKTVATSMNLKVEEAKGLKADAMQKLPFNDSGVQREILATSKPGKIPARVHEIGGKFYVVQVSAITAPDISTLGDKLAEARKSAESKLDQELVQAFLNTVKAKAKIETGPGVV
jgi:peptidyl-prolyl cis-trans isomerase D